MNNNIIYSIFITKPNNVTLKEVVPDINHFYTKNTALYARHE